jgi:hypothetical protein
MVMGIRLTAKAYKDIELSFKEIAVIVAQKFL